MPVTGAGGFIGGALLLVLRKQGHRGLRGVDIKPFDQWHQRFDDVENLSLDLNLRENCERAAEGAGDIYNLAANMGGMGFIANKALCMLRVFPFAIRAMFRSRATGTEKSYFTKASEAVCTREFSHL